MSLTSPELPHLKLNLSGSQLNGFSNTTPIKESEPSSSSTGEQIIPDNATKSNKGDLPVLRLSQTPTERNRYSLSSVSATKPKSTLTRSTSMRSKGLNLNTVSPIAVHASKFSSAPGSAHRRSVSGPVAQMVTLPHSSEKNFQHQDQASTQTETSSTYYAKSNHNTETNDLKNDLPLPQMDQLVLLDIDDQLRLLAYKEMSLVEIKDNITSLTQTLERHEKEIHKLREVIQRSLYKELNSPHGSVVTVPSSSANHLAVATPSISKKQGNPREEAIASTKNRSRRRTLSTSSPSKNPIDETAINSVASNANSATYTNAYGNGNGNVNNTNENRNSKIWSSISKPLNMLQQFDTMLQNEFEKSLTTSNQQALQTGNGQNLSIQSNLPRDSFQSDEVSSGITSHRSHLSEDSMSSFDSGSPLKSKSRNAKHIDLGHYDVYDRSNQGRNGNLHETSYRSVQPGTSKKDDVFQSVSSSIWTFVNDVTSNVLSSLSEEPNSPHENLMMKSPLLAPTRSPEAMYNLETGSTISLDKPNFDKFPDKFDSINNSDYEDILDSDEDSKIDLSMYSNARSH